MRVFAFVVEERCSQNDLCPAVIYLPGLLEGKPLGVAGSTGTCPPRFIQTLPPRIGPGCALCVCECVNEHKIFKLYIQVVEMEKEVRI